MVASIVSRRRGKVRETYHTGCGASTVKCELATRLDNTSKCANAGCGLEIEPGRIVEVRRDWQVVADAGREKPESKDSGLGRKQCRSQGGLGTQPAINNTFSVESTVLKCSNGLIRPPIELLESRDSNQSRAYPLPVTVSKILPNHSSQLRRRSRTLRVIEPYMLTRLPMTDSFQRRT